MHPYIEPFIAADSILNILRDGRQPAYSINDSLKNKHSPNNLVSAFNQLIKDGYIQKDNATQDWYTIFGTGSAFIHNGGYKAYFKELERKEVKDKNSKEIAERKTSIDILNAERVYKSYPFTRFAAIFGFISALVLLILKLLEVFGILSPNK
ncbi:MAG TPA: hypothetical protein VG738_25340 [Chitinophagaceae bacterium]|nr:hypothetical protein [Chitinophagaceae bacterium]